MNTLRKLSSGLIPPTKKAVIISTSNDIYTNLALEHWFYKHQNFEDKHMLMLWVNTPCVVIGRHQNPWTESNVSKLQSMGVQLARRNSGGGTVYHDRGNLNLTFFTPRDHYDRRYNLEFMARAIYKEFGLKIEISPREDLTLRDYKVSGTAAKLARLTAYHHCTLLVEANVDRLRSSLQPSKWEITTNATKSIKSKILNLTEENGEITVEKLLKSIGMRYLNHNNKNLESNMFDSVRKIRELNENLGEVPDRNVDFDGFKMHVIAPNEENFPGLNEIRNELSGWEWIYGKTPKFVVTKAFKIQAKAPPREPSEDPQKILFMKSRTYVFLVSVVVEGGLVAEINIKIPENYAGEQKLRAIDELRGIKYSTDVLEHLERHFSERKDLDEDLGVVVRRVLNKFN